MTKKLHFIFIFIIILLTILCTKPYDSFASDDTSNKITKPQVDNNLRNYLISVNSHIQKLWYLPTNVELDKNLQTVAIVRVNKNGQITKTELHEKSQSEYFNNLILQTIKKSNPLPPFPSGINQEEIEVGLRFKPMTFFVNPASNQDVSAEKKAEIEKLLQTTNALHLGQQFSAAITAQLSNTLRAKHANVPQKVLDVLPQEVNAVISENIPVLKEIMVNIYAQHFTLDELKGLNQFYSTDLGRKLISTLPSALQESMAAGQKWGQTLAPEIGRRIQARFKKEAIAP